jgi:imidazolonepropionase-like amidohydrolase
MNSLLILLFLLVAATGYSQNILIKHINIVDVTTGQIHADRFVHVANGKIQAIADRPVRARQAKKLNGKGKFLIPGLWDMHVHTADSSYLDLFILHGVTGIRDMGGAVSQATNGCESISIEKLLRWRQLIQSGTLIGPRMFVSGPVVSNTGWPTTITVRTPEDAQDAVKKLKGLGVDFVKVYEKIPLEAYQTLAREAAAAGLSIAGHVPVETVTLIEASNAGHRSIEHVRDPLLMSFTNDREELLQFFKDDHWSASDIAWGLEQFEQSSAVIDAFKKNNTWLVPTLTVESAKVTARDSLHVNNARRKLLPGSVQQGFSAYVAQKLALSEELRQSDSLWWIKQKQLVNRMHKAGIPFMAGTDCACEGGIPGYSLHKELQLFVEAGLTPLEALQTATINPARFLKMEDSLGTVEIGKTADLLILDNNPTTDISATETILAVILNGQLLTKKRLRKIKTDLAFHKNNRKHELPASWHTTLLSAFFPTECAIRIVFFVHQSTVIHDPICFLV